MYQSGRLYNCLIVRNTAAASGGGVHAGNVYTGTFSIQHCTIADNVAASGVGGLYVKGQLDMSVYKCLVTGNRKGEETVSDLAGEAAAEIVANCFGSESRDLRVMTQNTKARVVTYSCRSMADHTCRTIEQSFEGMLLRIDNKEAWSGLIGQHNAYNLLALYTTAVELGSDPEEVLVAMSTLRPAPGRLENMKGPKDISVIIDYAHTPDALENVLKTVREIAPERELICVFGCGGDRDKTKRPEMAKIAQKMADRIIVTADNSRTEKTVDIMADIKAGMDISGKAKSLFIEDREQAIRTAIMMAGQGATILLAGKGHETYQIIGTEKTHFDEKAIVAEAFKDIAE